MIRSLVSLLVFVVNTLYHDRPIARFYLLETVARVPYFAFLSVLHFYETIGCWRRVDWIKVHFAESWNELHHLLILESVEEQRWVDRFVAQHLAVFYYWVVVALYLISPHEAYYFMELLERYAYQTYDNFIKQNETGLKATKAPQVAIKYYRDGDLYMFDEFQISHPLQERRPEIQNLYDVFVAIRDDEMEHVKTMVACQHPDARNTFKSPHTPALEIIPPPADLEEAAALVR